MTEPEHRRSTYLTIKTIGNLKDYFKRLTAKDKSWQPNLDATTKILEILESSEPSAEAINEVLSSMPRSHDYGSAWYEVRCMIWLWEGSIRNDKVWGRLEEQ